MTVHSNGNGDGWLETLDIDQPHGIDYREFNDLRIGIRLRMGQEHSTFADSTAGGIHKPGGVAVLGMEITDAAGDPTSTVVADGTYRARGLVWSYTVQAGANKGVLYCTSDAAGVSTTGDWTVLKMHPDLQWSGGDVTWAGAHEFDASVDISGNVAMDGDLTVDGAFALGGNAKIVGDCSVDGTFTVGGDAAFLADTSFDGTADFGDDVAFVADVSVDGTTALQNMVLTGDSTFTFDPIAGETGPTFNILGDWSTRAQDTTYTARTDGIVVACSSANGAQYRGQTPAGTAVVGGYANTTPSGFSFPVKNGDTWAVAVDTTTLTVAVRWIPLGDNT